MTLYKSAYEVRRGQGGSLGRGKNMGTQKRHDPGRPRRLRNPKRFNVVVGLDWEIYFYYTASFSDSPKQRFGQRTNKIFVGHTHHSKSGAGRQPSPPCCKNGHQACPSPLVAVFAFGGSLWLNWGP